MYQDVIDHERCTRIAQIARALWLEFIDLNNECGAETILSPSQIQIDATDTTLGSQRDPSRLLPRNECAVAFFQHCSEMMNGIRAEVANYSLENLVPQCRGLATSWLWNMPQPLAAGYQDYAVALIDSEQLAKVAPSQLPRIWTRLLLHEAGHVVLHWRELDRQRSEGKVPTATAIQEAEAWWFCSCVVGMAIAKYAHDARDGGKAHEDAWRVL